MILTTDVGNTNVKFGVFDNNRLVTSWRISVGERRTSDEYGVLLCTMLSVNGINPKDINGVIMSSVVPKLNFTIEGMIQRFFNKTPVIVGPGIKTGLNLKVDNPREIGGDILCDCVGASRKYGTPCIVMDFGTATTISAITRDKEFIGAAILPGVKTAIEALAGKAAKLPDIELQPPVHAIGKNTVECMRSGLLFGYAGQIEFLSKRFRQEMGEPDAKLIATGGMSRTIAKITDVIDEIDSNLTLEGLNYIYQSNCNREDRNK